MFLWMYARPQFSTTSGTGKGHLWSEIVEWCSLKCCRKSLDSSRVESDAPDKVGATLPTPSATPPPPVLSAETNPGNVLIATNSNTAAATSADTFELFGKDELILMSNKIVDLSCATKRLKDI